MDRSTVHLLGCGDVTDRAEILYFRTYSDQVAEESLTIEANDGLGNDSAQGRVLCLFSSINRSSGLHR